MCDLPRLEGVNTLPIRCSFFLSFSCSKKIDFGLTFESSEIEHKAVDLHLLKQALESKHYKIWEDAYKIFLKSYEKEAKDGKEIIKKLEVVETRGRYKHK